jgi:hypothetical protein
MDVFRRKVETFKRVTTSQSIIIRQRTSCIVFPRRRWSHICRLFCLSGENCVLQPENSLFKLIYLVFSNGHSCGPLNAQWNLSKTSVLSVHGVEYYDNYWFCSRNLLPFTASTAFTRAPGGHVFLTPLLREPNRCIIWNKIITTQILQNILTCSTVILQRWREGKCVFGNDR